MAYVTTTITLYYIYTYICITRIVKKEQKWLPFRLTLLCLKRISNHTKGKLIKSRYAAESINIAGYFSCVCHC